MAEIPEEGETRFYPLESDAQSDGCSRKLYHRASTLQPLRHILARWCQRVGLQLVLQESRSCYHRIRLRSCRTSGSDTLLFSDLRRSLPPLCEADSSMRTQPYIAGIRTLERDRPYATLGDIELFLTGWFQAERWYGHSDNESSRQVLASASPAQPDSMPLREAQQDSTRDLLAQLPSQVLRDELARRGSSCTTQQTESQPREDSPASSSIHLSGELSDADAS